MPKVKSFSILLILSIFFVVMTVLVSSPAAEASGVHQLGYFPLTVSSSSSPICDGSIGECLAEEGSDEEFSVDSESTRRMLAYRRRYISYGALSRNRVPCSRRGASYYNCRPGAQANPYRRGCSAITRCRG
ncbi:rapid alkalinization factor [Capsicum chacoense]|uniref:Protein RALF-like 1 n=1 Tax=Capsicum annuum TaxID=4072 RepID=A0A1U8F0G1_CAPAN|nr:rapid alkalinization factor [Capsicum annuum]KAF3634499.1 Protein RALF-like 1 [Capsicum annuum]KAF3637102.1 Protein RALF-like 1 [Capsicum annuum]PHT95027.1 Protein RALF-like 1 [Capsicum annuum]